MKLSRNFKVVLLSIAFAMLILEVSLRLLRMDLAPLLAGSHQPCLYVEDSRTGYKYAPNARDRIFRFFEMNNVVETNSAGFHDVEHFIDAGRDTHTILVVGDSFTAGLHVPTDDVWTRELERQLLQLRPEMPLQVVNLGLDGTGTDIHTLILEENLPLYRPDTVIVAFYENDIGDMERPMLYKECYAGNVLVYQNPEQKAALQRYVEENRPNGLLRWLFENYYTFRLPVIAIKQSGRRLNYTYLLDTNYIFPSAIGVHKWRWGNIPHQLDQRLLTLQALSERHGFRLLLVPVPTKNSISETMGILTAAASRNVLESLEIVDISPYLQQVLEKSGLSYAEMFWRYDGHFNSKGHQVFGSALSMALSDLNVTATPQ